jgi:hypothetical protein
MALLKRLLRADGLRETSADSDWWYLVFDTDTARLCVVHEWGSAELHRLGTTTGGTVELDVAAYLTRRDDPGQHELVRLVQTLFENRAG